MEAPAELSRLRDELLAARERREEALARARSLPAVVGGEGAFLQLGTSIPGPYKCRPPLRPLLRRGLDRLLHDPRPSGDPVRHRLLEEGEDLLGPFCLVWLAADPAEVKRCAVAVEEELPGGRLLDVDVYEVSGRRLGRAELGLPPRGCLVCSLAAHECMRRGQHGPDELEVAVARILEGIPRD